MRSPGCADMSAAAMVPGGRTSTVAPASDGIAGAPPSQDTLPLPASMAAGAVAAGSAMGAPALPEGIFEDPPAEPASGAGISTCVTPSPAAELPVLGAPSLEVPQLTPTPTDKAAKGSQFLRADMSGSCGNQLENRVTASALTQQCPWIFPAL